MTTKTPNRNKMDELVKKDVDQGWANFSPRGPHGTSGWSPEGRIKKTKFTR